MRRLNSTERHQNPADIPADSECGACCGACLCLGALSHQERLDRALRGLEWLAHEVETALAAEGAHEPPREATLPIVAGAAFMMPRAQRSTVGLRTCQNLTFPENLRKPQVHERLPDLTVEEGMLLSPSREHSETVGARQVRDSGPRRGSREENNPAAHAARHRRRDPQ